MLKGTAPTDRFAGPGRSGLARVRVLSFRWYEGGTRFSVQGDVCCLSVEEASIVALDSLLSSCTGQILRYCSGERCCGVRSPLQIVPACCSLSHLSQLLC